MKKLVLFFAVVVAVSFASCGNKAKTEEAPAADSTSVVEEAPAAADTAAAVADTTTAAAEAPAAK